jgi:hypothetical protein
MSYVNHAIPLSEQEQAIDINLYKTAEEFKQIEIEPES